MAQLQFLDSSGLKSVLNKIKDTFVPKSRKIANIDLNNDITAEELGNNLKDYVGGKSAYEVAVDNGFVGSERRWIESLKGENAYELAQQDGFSGTEEEWIESLKGENAYELAQQDGFSGTEEEWLESLKGEDVTHEWEGTILTITSASGTSSSDLKGPRGTSVTDTMLVEDDKMGNVIMTWFDYEDGNEVEY